MTTTRRAAHDALMAALEERLLRGPAEASSQLRTAAAAGQGDGALGEYAKQVVQAAYKVTPEQLAALRQAHSDDALFEVTVSAAFGAAQARTAKALAMIDAAWEGGE